ncbi:MAG: glycosyltransferase family protein [Jiangellaceae bacterium]
MGIGEPGNGPAGADVRATIRGSLRQRVLRALTMPWRARGAVIVCLDPDVAIGSVPVRVFRRRKLVVDVHEDYGALLDDRAWATGIRGWIARRMVRLASAVAARADLTVVADDHIPPYAHRCRRRIVVQNLPDMSLIAAPGRGDGTALRAVYVGDVRRSRGAQSMIEALATAPGWTLDIVGPVSKDDAPWLAERLAEPDLAGRVRLHGRQPPAAAWRIARDAVVGLALLESTTAFRAAMPTKVYEYLAAGMAVLATPLPRVEELLAESGGGVVVNDAEDASAALRHWTGAGAAELEKLRAAARVWSDGLSPAASPYDQLANELPAIRVR